MWGGSRGHPGIAPDGLSSVGAEISSPSRLLPRPWWPEHPPPRARGIFGFPGWLPISGPKSQVPLPLSGCGPPQSGERPSPAVFLTVQSNRGKERGRLQRAPGCGYALGPAGVLSAGGIESSTEGKKPLPLYFYVKRLHYYTSPEHPKFGSKYP